MKAHCRKAKKRRAYPEWGFPVELAWMLIEPNINLSGPTEKTKGLEAQRIRAAEKEGDEEELEKYSAHYILANGRTILQKL
eukprot:695183-Pyramimonas_sp.AAC.1